MRRAIKAFSRRQFVPVACFVISVGTLSACGGGRVGELEAEIEHLEDQVGQARVRLEELESLANDMQSAATDLENTASRFDGENWQDVVPDLQSEAADETAG